MSECVVRMEMPKCCDDCAANYDCCACGISGEFWFRNPRYKEFDSSKERLPNCPIFCQLPEGHGRLVDADELKAKQQEDADLFINAYTLMEKSRRDEALNAVANIVNATTIVPAEAERSET